MSVVVRYSEDIEKSIREIESVLKRDEALLRYNIRWLAVKLLEGDEEVVKRVSGSPIREKIFEVVERERRRIREKYGEEPEVVLADQRYEIVGRVARAVMKGVRGLTPSDLLDKVVLDKYLGIPIFIVVLWLMFQFAINVSAPFCDILGDLFAWLAENLSTGNAVFDDLFFGDYGVLNGIGTILSFVPIIFFLYFALSILEDSGYMARAAFVMDRLMRKLGLTGRAVISMILGFGCNVPGVYSTRAIPDEGDRLIAIVINPLIPCSARLVVFACLAYVFFGPLAGNVIFSMYVLGIGLAVLIAIIMRKSYLKGRVSPFILELPPYQAPTLRTVILHAYERGILFFKKAGTVIFGGLLVLEILMHLQWPLGWGPVETSVICALGKALQPLFSPMGWDWRLVVAVVFGFVAKEIVLGATAALYGVPEEGLGARLGELYTPVQAFSYMVFVLAYVPCVATVAAIAHERGWKWAAFTVAYELVLAYVLALVVSLLGGALW